MPKLQRFQRKPHDGGQVKGSINYSNTQGRKDLMTDRIQTQNDEITKTAESFPNGNQTHKDLNSFITCESIIQRDFFILTKLIERSTDAHAKLQMRLSAVATQTNSSLHPKSGKSTKMSLSKESQIGQILLHASNGMNRGSIWDTLQTIKKQWPLSNGYRDVLKVIYEDYTYK